MAGMAETAGFDKPQRPSQREQQRERRERYRADGRCLVCGQTREGAGASAQHCPTCAAKDRERKRAWIERRAAAERAKAAESGPPAPAARTCPYCGSGDLRPDGRNAGSLRYKYRCKGCRRKHSGDAPLPPRPTIECPNSGCGGTCIRHGIDTKSRQKYLCHRCGKINTLLWYTQPKSPGGPFPHKITLYLSLSAQRALQAYCNRYGMSRAQAARDIFRKWADEPVRAMAAGTRRVPLPTRPREPIPERLPNVSSETTRARMAAGGRRHYSVLVVETLGMALDDLAFQGLLRFMRKTGLNHQDAARNLICRASPNPDWRV